MTPGEIYSLLNLFLGLTLVGVTLLIKWDRGRAVQICASWVMFSSVIVTIIATRRLFDIPLVECFFILVVVFEEIQKGAISRLLNNVHSVWVCATFASAELVVTKANILLPTPGYLDGIGYSSVILEVLFSVVGVAFHMSTGLIYEMMKNRPLILPIVACIPIHLLYNYLS